jgi:hypothetical protein
MLFDYNWTIFFNYGTGSLTVIYILILDIIQVMNYQDIRVFRDSRTSLNIYLANYLASFCGRICIIRCIS